MSEDTSVSPMKPWSYRGRWGLVTGASAGIGEAFARQLAARGMNLVLTARRLDRLQALASELEAAHGISAIAIEADLGVAGEAQRLWDAAGEGRLVSLVVNNAGFGARGGFDEVPLARQLEMVQVNCTSLLELSHLALSSMRERRDGGIINVSSIAAFQAVAELATYAASKAFVLSLSEALWAENRERGIRVTALCPGRTPTEFQEIAGTGSADSAFGVRTADQVVEAGLAAFERGKSYEVPGTENLLATWLVRLAPRSAVARAGRALVRRGGLRKRKRGPMGAG